MIKNVKVIINNKEYKLKFSASATIEIEQKYGSLIDAINNFANDGSIKMSLLIDIFTASFSKYHPELSITDRLNLYDDYMDEHNMNDLTTLFMNLMESSGFINNDNSEKN